MVYDHEFWNKLNGTGAYFSFSSDFSDFWPALKELVISAKHSYYTEIQSPERYLPAGLNIHLQQQPMSLCQLTKVRFGRSKVSRHEVYNG